MVSESLFTLPPGLPFKFLQLELLMMSYRSEHARNREFTNYVYETPLTLSAGLPLEFLQLEELLMSYRSVHVVINVRARRCARGLIFSAFHRHPIFMGVCRQNN